MGLFDFLKPKKKEMPPQEPEIIPEAEIDQDRVDRLWDLWAEGKAQTPWAELMTYEAEINNGGHSQFFLNVSNTGDIAQTAQVLLEILPGVLKENFQKAYRAYLQDPEERKDATTERFDACDEVFYEHEGLLIALLAKYADRV